MCDDHGHGPPGPGVLTWGRSALWSGIPLVISGAVLWADASLPSVVDRTLSIAVGPLLLLAGWSMARFVRAGSDGVAVRFSGIAYAVAGAILSLTPFLGSVELASNGMAGWLVWLGVGSAALGISVQAHPLFGAPFGWGGVVLGVASIAWVGAGLPAASGLGGGALPVVALSLWYGVALVRTGTAVRRLSRGYAGWSEPALA